jgi:hypothetical protein
MLKSAITRFDRWSVCEMAMFVRRDSAVKLVDDLAGESPVSADYPVGAVVISGDGTGDQAVGSLDVNALEGWT